MEDDRKFNIGNTDENAYPVKDYYIDKFPLPLLGFYNSVIRATHPHHIHHFDVGQFESAKILQQNYELIKNEALQIYNKKNVMNMKDIGNSFFDDIDEAPNKWKIYVIKWYDKINDNALKNCPITSKIISELKDVHIAMFSILEPGKYIVPHKGPSTVCLRYHLGLKIPTDKQNCFIKVNNEKFYWTEGEGLIFDDTYVHSVYNNTNETRIILFVDIERPLNFPFNYMNQGLLKLSPFVNFVANVNDAVEKKSSGEIEYFTV